MENLAVEVTQDSKKKPMVLIRVVKDHDLVLEFSYASERKKFLGKLENFLQVCDHFMTFHVLIQGDSKTLRLGWGQLWF